MTNVHELKDGKWVEAVPEKYQPSLRERIADRRRKRKALRRGKQDDE